MRNFRYWLIILCPITALFIHGQPDNNMSLAEIYKNGTVRFIPEVTIDDSSMPEGIFFESVVRVVCDDDGDVYACDYRAHNIKKFDSSGKYIQTIGREGQGPGEFKNPYRIAVTNDRLIVMDSGNRRFCALTLGGEFIKSTPILLGELPQKIMALPNGDIAIEVEKMHYREPDKPQEYSIEIYSPDLEKKKTIYSQQIWRYKPVNKEGRFVHMGRPFSPRICWDVLPKGNIAIGYSKDYKIEIFDSDQGKISSFTYEYKPVSVTEKDKEKYFASIGIFAGGEFKMGADEFTRKNAEFPKFKPAFHQIKVDSEGNILVMAHRKNADEEARFFDAFDDQGNFLGNVKIIGNLGYPYHADIKDGTFWLARVDEEGLAKIVKYRISD